MVDQWEADTLLAVNSKVGLARSLEFDKSLRKEAFDYATAMNRWLPTEEAPSWVIQRVKEWPGAHGDLPAFATYRFKSDDIEYSCFCQYDADFLRYSEYGGNLRSIECQARKLLPGCGSVPVSSPNFIVASCYCPHWTSPQRIAELLLEKGSGDFSHYKRGAVAIHNDETCTYAVLACR